MLNIAESSIISLEKTIIIYKEIAAWLYKNGEIYKLSNTNILISICLNIHLNLSI